MEKLKHIVESGDLHKEVMAINHITAIVVAINEILPKELGQVISVIAENEDAESYYFTEMILDKMDAILILENNGQ